MSKATIRKWLEEVGFDFNVGVIVVGWYTKPEEYYDGTVDLFTRRYDDPDYRSTVGPDHPILSHGFHDGFGCANCPPFIAKDSRITVICGVYDGATFPVVIRNNPLDYLDVNQSIPTPGGQ